MDEDEIDDLADSLYAIFEYTVDPRKLETLYDAIHHVAIVVNNHNPTYDLRYFYKRAGYPEPYPEHELQY
jgi:hypothetical protein